MLHKLKNLFKKEEEVIILEEEIKQEKKQDNKPDGRKIQKVEYLKVGSLDTKGYNFNSNDESKIYEVKPADKRYLLQTFPDWFKDVK